MLGRVAEDGVVDQNRKWCLELIVPVLALKWQQDEQMWYHVLNGHCAICSVLLKKAMRFIPTSISSVKYRLSKPSGFSAFQMIRQSYIHADVNPLHGAVQICCCTSPVLVLRALPSHSTTSRSAHQHCHIACSVVVA